MSRIDLTRGEFNEFLEEKSVTENDENYETEEEEDDVSGNIPTRIKLKIKNEKINFRRKTTKLPPGRLTVSLRNRKFSWQTKTKKPTQNSDRKKIKKPLLRTKFSEKRVETLKLGKRCYLGGKAKVKPTAPQTEKPFQENHDKNDSDDDSDSTYFSRISLGHFQQLRDKSGASTSYENEEERPHELYLNQNKTQDEKSEEEELKELQIWGRNVLDTYFYTIKVWGNYRKLLGHVNK